MNEKKTLLHDVQQYVKKHFVPRTDETSTTVARQTFAFLGATDVRSFQKGALSAAVKDALLQDIQAMLTPAFRELLFDLIRKQGLKNADLYRRATLTKAHFSKTKHDERYHPSKDTVLALALALKLTLDETQEFLKRAGYTLTDSSKTDLIVRFFIERQMYDVDEVNSVLDELGLPPITNKKETKERKDGW